MPPCADCKASTCCTARTKLEKILIWSIIVTTALTLAVSCAYLATSLGGKGKDKEKNKEIESKSSKDDKTPYTETKDNIDDNVCLTESCIFSAMTILENMDPEIAPCEDFYNFACGNFVKKTIIPEDQNSVNTFSIVKESLQKKMKYMLEEPIQTNELKPFKMIKEFYKTCMNVDLIERDGLKTIRSILKELGGWPVLEGDKWAESRFDWKELIYKFWKIGFSDESLFKILVQEHSVYSDRRVLHMIGPSSQREQNLQKRLWARKKVKNIYFRYMVDSAVQFGADRKRSAAELLETFIFHRNISTLSKRTADNSTDINVTNLKQTFPNFTWMGFINKLLALYDVTVNDNEKLIVNLEYLKGLGSLLQTVSKRTLANYMIWKFVSYCSPFLNKAFRETHLRYTGVTSDSVRWKNCLEEFMVERSIQRESLFIAAGALYVRKYFSKKDKKDAQKMISNIFRSFQDTLEHIDWMDGVTQKKALEKAKAMIMNTAYPDEFLNDTKLLLYYDDFELNENNYLKSILKLNLFDIRHHFKRLREPVERKDWIEQGQVATDDAFYSDRSNSINVPVGILQKQTFSSHRPNYLNYGAIGSVIGHEITHGFDDNGRQYDKDGNLVHWWTPKSDKSFESKTVCIAEQYSKYEFPELNMTVNGDLTLNENIADNGGLATSYKAYQKWVEKHGTEKTLPGLKFSPNQLFWISMANFYCSKETPEILQQDLLDDDHSPCRFRVIGPLSNNEDFAKDFDCLVGSPMNPQEKCKLW